jgi:hypothetical protein
LKFGTGVKVITPAVMFLHTVGYRRLSQCGSGVQVVPLILCIVGVVPSGSLSPVNGNVGLLVLSSGVGYRLHGGGACRYKMLVIT